MHEFRRAWEQTTLERFLALTHQYHIDMKKFNEKTGKFEDVINDSMLNKSIIFNEQTGQFEYNANSYSLPAKRHRTYAHSQVYFAIQDIIVEILGVDETDVVPEASFIDDLGADSLDCVELIMEFEKTFDIIIPDEHAERFYTVADAINYIEACK